MRPVPGYLARVAEAGRPGGTAALRPPRSLFAPRGAPPLTGEEARPQPPAPAPAAASSRQARPRPYAAASRCPPGRAGRGRRAGPYWNRTRTAARAAGRVRRRRAGERRSRRCRGRDHPRASPAGRQASRRGRAEGTPTRPRPGYPRRPPPGARRGPREAPAPPSAGRRGGRPPLPRGRHRARASERPHRRRGPGRRHTPARGAPRPGRRPGTPGPGPGTPRPGAPHPEVPGRERQPGTTARPFRIAGGRAPRQVLRRTQPPARPAAARTARYRGRPITWTRSPSWFRPGGPGRTERNTATRPGPARGPTRRGTTPSRPGSRSAPSR